MQKKQARYNNHDVEVLHAVAEHQVLTMGQASSLLARNPKALSRRLNQLEAAGLVQKTSRGFGRGRGRPESIVSLTEEGLAKLVEAGVVGRSAFYDNLPSLDPSMFDHQLLVNWFRIHLVHLERLIQGVSIEFVSPTSPFLGKGSEGRRLVHERAPAAAGDQAIIEFIPDGVFIIKGTLGESCKTLLFFLEVDMDTESMVSSAHPSKDIRQKLHCYQSYFRSLSYKRYEKVWNCSLTGFRLLFLSNTAARKTAICRLVQEMRPSNFVWVADQESMFAKGLGAKIWARGGMDQKPPESILGRLATAPAPLSR